MQTVKAKGALPLQKPRTDCAEYKTKAYSLLKTCLSLQSLELVDFEMLLMLSSAMTGYLEPLEAIRLILHNVLLLFETLEWTRPGWATHVNSFPTVWEDMSLAVEPTGTKSISRETWIEAFKHLDADGSTSELVTTLHLTVDASENIAKKYCEMKALDAKRISRTEVIGDPEIQRLERDVKLAELRRRKAEQENPLDIDRKLADLTITLTTPGQWKQEHCSYMKENYCMYWYWKQSPSVPYRIGEPLIKGGK